MSFPSLWRERHLATAGAALALGLASLLPAPAAAHDLRPALLRLEEGPGGEGATISLRWRARAGRPGPRLELPAGCEGRLLESAPGLRRWRSPCPLDRLLAEGRLALDPFTPDAVLRVHRGEAVETSALGPDSPRLGAPSSEAPALLRLDLPGLGLPGLGLPGLGLLGLGVEHILFGADHLCFVLGLLLLVLGRRPEDEAGDPATRRARLRRLALAITAFTVAHSLTLALSVLGLVRLPERGVEAAIAASLLLLGVELCRSEGRSEGRREESFTRRHPEGVAFAFGLLHGFGFAGALRAVGLPESDLGSALLAFNVGVELGQLAFLGACLLALAALGRLARRAPWPRIAAYGIGGLGALWLLQRGAPIVAQLFITGDAT